MNLMLIVTHLRLLEFLVNNDVKELRYLHSLAMEAGDIRKKSLLFQAIQNQNKRAVELYPELYYKFCVVQKLKGEACEL